MNMSLDVLLYKINWAVVPLAMKLFTLSYFTRLRITLLIPGKGAPSSGRPSGQTVSSVPFSRSSCLCDPMDCSTPGLPIHHQLPEFTQTHVHRADDAIQPSHSLSSPSPPAFNLSQHQGFFHWVSSSHQVTKVLEFQLQHRSFQWIFRTDFL